MKPEYKAILHYLRKLHILHFTLKVSAANHDVDLMNIGLSEYEHLCLYPDGDAS